ncbi:MAG TPA: argininosuccinate lyase [Chitinispirillaceae bacterium]|nr:argininosuccinate lyase [Chitinispirillaceae bacterium]
MKMWDGRFSKPSDRLMEQFHNSLPFDKTLIEEDIRGSIAWAAALKEIAVFTADEYEVVKKGLEDILSDYSKGLIQFLPQDEDIHMAVERVLIQRIGDTGARLHTGRSRNDQVATDCRLYVKKVLKQTFNAVVNLQNVLICRAETDSEIIIPGFTHLQQAQPILLSHYWLSFFFLLEREKSRLLHAIETTDIMPLGAGAMAGSGFNVDRFSLADRLEFSKPSQNSIDAVSSRDFILEALSVAASIGIHLSRYAEDLIIWCSREFGFTELDDAWSTGSSIMPQKKNPDSLELIRGKSGRFVGNYMRFATTLKGVGLTYYKDLQEDKEPLFDSFFQLDLILQVFAQVIATLKINTGNISNDLDPFLLATDLADYLVRKGMPFRHAHKVIGKIVAHCIENKLQMNQMTVEQLRGFSDLFVADVLEVFSWQNAIDARNVYGGTGSKSVKEQIMIAKNLLA